MDHQLLDCFIQYGQQQCSFETLQAHVKALTNRTISKFIVDDYWGYREIEEIIAQLLDESIEDWKQFETVQEVALTIKNYESGALDLEATQQKLLNATGKVVDQYELDHYWRSEDLEEFVATIATAAIEDWAAIDDARALQLIVELIDHGTTAFVWRNGTALEKRYGQPIGTVQDLIFWKDLSPAEILQALKKDPVTK